MACVKRKRRPNFSSDELDVLAEEVGVRKREIYEKFSDCMSNERKQKAWRQIATHVSAASMTERGPDEVRKKWSDWSSAVKMKAAKKKISMNKTGGGTDDTPALTPVEEKVIEIIGIIALDGIAGGIESGSSKSAKPVAGSSKLKADPAEKDELRQVDDDIDGSPDPSTSDGIARPVKKQKSATSTVTHASENAIIQIEREKLKIKQERLEIERSRLVLEQRRLAKEHQLVDLSASAAARTTAAWTSATSAAARTSDCSATATRSRI